jgi:hypothetical protein
MQFIGWTSLWQKVTTTEAKRRGERGRREDERGVLLEGRGSTWRVERRQHGLKLVHFFAYVDGQSRPRFLLRSAPRA